MGNEQKQENLNNQNIQEQEPKQMMPYVDNQDMKERQPGLERVDLRQSYTRL